MTLKPADIILTRGYNLLSKAIITVLRLFQKDEVDFNHALMVADENIGIEAGTKIQYVNLKDVLEGAEGYKIIRRVDLTDEQRMKIIKKANKCIGQEYGYLRLIMQLFDQIFHTNWFTRRLKYRNHICSGLVAWAYFVVRRIKFNDVPWRSCEPDDVDDESLKNPDLWEIVGIK